MKTPQHLFALTKPEQRVVLLIILGLLFATTFSHYHRTEKAVPQAVPTRPPESKQSAEENSEED